MKTLRNHLWNNSDTVLTIAVDRLNLTFPNILVTHNYMSRFSYLLDIYIQEQLRILGKGKT